MTITPITIWGVFTTVNEYGAEGGPAGFWTTEQSAKNNTRGHGWYGGPGNVRQLPALQLPDGRIFALLQAEPVRLGVDLVQQERDAKAAALAKLSPEERKLLGLSGSGD